MGTADQPIRPRYRAIVAACWPRAGRAARCGDMTVHALAAEADDLQMIHGTRAVLGLLAGKWSVDILYLLATGTRRYNEVLYEVGEISKKTLTQTLRSLEHDGLVARHVRGEVPLHVEYSLTPLGWSMTEPLMAMYEWAERHLLPPPPEPADPRGF
jgi:DNA-binding HxlR family transcriptional regulator